MLVTLQFGLSPAEQLEPLANLLQEAGSRLCFWVRLHPAMLERRNEIRARLCSGSTVEIDECSDLPLQALLPYCDLHLTHSSSTVIEAAQFGVPSVLTTAYGGELFAPLVAAGHARVLTGDAAQLARALVESTAGGDRQSAPAPPADAALEQLLAASPASTTWKFA